MKILTMALCMLLCCTLVGQNFQLKKTRSDSRKLDLTFNQYETYNFDLSNIDSELQKNIGSTIQLISDDFKVELELVPVDLLAADFEIKAIGRQGTQYIDYKEVNTYIAYDTANPDRAYRYYISDTRFQGMFEFKGEIFRIESRNKYDKQADPNTLVVYKPQDRITKNEEENYSCQLLDEHVTIQPPKEDATNRSMTGCSEVELAIAADYLLFEEQGGIDGVLEELVSIMNDVQGDYSTQFNDAIEFKITELMVSMCEECDPWISTNSMSSLLSWFKDWGLNDGFEKPHDLGLLWTDRVTTGGVVGVAYLNSLCGTNRYSAMRHFTNDPGKLRMMVSHEIGHTFGCPHNYSPGNSSCHPNPGRPPLIMDPIVNSAAVSWSTGIEPCVDTDPGDSSVDRINAKLTQADCFSTCSDPSCNPVTALEVLNITGSNAQVVWTGSADSYTVKLREDMSNNFIIDQVTTNNFFNFDGSSLNPDERYVVSVVANCGSEESAIREVVFFTCTTLSLEDGESGWGVWNDGGDDAALANNATYANSGTHSFLIKDNTNTSIITSDAFDLSTYPTVNVVFNYVAIGFNTAAQDFWLQVSTDGGTSFETIEEWNYTDEFQNGVREFEDLAFSGPFSTNTIFRFTCDATGNNDKVYIDDIQIIACETELSSDENDSDGDGVDDYADCEPLNPNIYPGAPCDDGDSCTSGDLYAVNDDGDCNCIGATIVDPCDSDGDGVDDFTDCAPLDPNIYPGAPCDDGDPCTTGDLYAVNDDGDCNCIAGTIEDPCDSDGDGVDDYTDCAPLDPNIYPGAPCDDGDPCTTGDLYAVNDDGDCNCIGGASGSVTVDFENFESGWGIWNDGGADARRNINDAAYAYSPDYCVLIRDNTSTSNISTDVLDLSSYSEVNVSFTFIAHSMEVNEDFFLEVSTDNGSTFSIVESWVSGTDFENMVREFPSVTLSNLSATTVLRFRCDASSNADRIFLDDINISTCGSSQPILASIQDAEIPIELSVYPNPAMGDLPLFITSENTFSVKQLMVYDLQGYIIYSTDTQLKDINKVEVPTDLFTSGTYFIRITTDKELITKRFVYLK